MTITSLILRRAPVLRRAPLAGRSLLVALTLCLAPAGAMAWQQQRTSTQAPPPVSYNAVQAQQANQQAVLMDKLRTNQVLEQQRQRNAAAVRRPFETTPGATAPLDLSNQSQADRFDARQRDAVNQYRAASAATPLVLPQPVQQPPKKGAKTNPPPAQQARPQH